MRSENS